MKRYQHTKRHLYIGIFIGLIACLAVVSAIRTGITFSSVLIPVVFFFMAYLFLKTYRFEERKWAEQKRLKEEQAANQND